MKKMLNLIYIIFITLIFVFIYSLTALLQRNWDLVAKIAGVPSISEIMEEETQGTDVALVGDTKGGTANEAHATASVRRALFPVTHGTLASHLPGTLS